MIRWTAAEREARDAYRKQERERRASALVSEKVVKGSHLLNQPSKEGAPDA